MINVIMYRGIEMAAAVRKKHKSVIKTDADLKETYWQDCQRKTWE